MIPDGVTWPDVAGAFILALPGIVAAIVGVVNHRNLRTSNGKTVAQLVEDVHEKASTAGTAFPPETATGTSAAPGA